MSGLFPTVHVMVSAVRLCVVWPARCNVPVLCMDLACPPIPVVSTSAADLHAATYKSRLLGKINSAVESLLSLASHKALRMRNLLCSICCLVYYMCSSYVDLCDSDLRLTYRKVMGQVTMTNYGLECQCPHQIT